MNIRYKTTAPLVLLSLLAGAPANAAQQLLYGEQHSVWWPSQQCAAATDVQVRSRNVDQLLQRSDSVDSLLRTAAVAISFQCRDIDRLNYELIDDETDEVVRYGSADRYNDWRSERGYEVESHQPTESNAASPRPGSHGYRVAGIELGMSFEAASAIMREQFGERPGYFPDRGLLVNREGICRAEDRSAMAPTELNNRDDIVHGRCLRVWMSADSQPVVQRVVLVHRLARDLGHDVDAALQQRFGPAELQSPIYDPKGHGYHIKRAYWLGWGVPVNDEYELEAEIIERVDATRVVIRLGATAPTIARSAN